MTLAPESLQEESSRPSSSRKSVVQKVATTAGVFASLVGAATPAEADVVVVNDRGFEAFGFVGWDIDGDGGDEFWLRSRVSSASTYSNANFETFLFLSSVNEYGAALNGNLVVPEGLGNEMVALSNGFAINSMLPSAYQFGNANGIASRIITGHLYQRQGPFSDNPVIDQVDYLGNNLEFGLNYFGFQFEQNGETLYGWAEMEIGTNFSVNINRWAYESTPGESINVGAVPEPGSLALLGLGAGGLLAWRRKREQG